MILRVLCPGCARPMEVDLHVIGRRPFLSKRCLKCDPSGKWQMELVDVIYPPGGRPPWEPPRAPVDWIDI